MPQNSKKNRRPLSLLSIILPLYYASFFSLDSVPSFMASMTYEMVLDNLDSFWLFSNVLSPPLPPPSTCILEERIEEPQPTPSQVPQLPSSDLHPVLQPQCNNSPTVEIAGSEQKTGNPEIFQAISVEPGKKTRVGEHSTRRKSRLRKKAWEEEFKQLALELGSIRSNTAWNSATAMHNCTIPTTGKWLHRCDMPSLSDGFAMKQHLKSWAHAVACTVK